jgi:hypothetical protein
MNRIEFRPKKINGKYAHQVVGYKVGDLIRCQSGWPHINLILKITPGTTPGMIMIHSVRFLKNRDGKNTYLPANRIRPIETYPKGYGRSVTYYGLTSTARDAVWWIVEEVLIENIDDTDRIAENFIRTAKIEDMYWNKSSDHTHHED